MHLLVFTISLFLCLIIIRYFNLNTKESVGFFSLGFLSSLMANSLMR